MTYLSFKILPVMAFLAILSQAVIAADSDVPDPFSQAVTAVRQKDYNTAYQLFSQLAEDGDYDAQYNLAVLFKKGLGHPTHYQNALKWAFLAELGGIGKATDMRKGLVDVMPEATLDLVRAEVKKVLTQRFDASDRSVILQLAQYNLTIVKEPDLKTVYALRALAAAIGIRSAMELRDEIEAELEPKDLIDAQHMAAKLYEETRWPLPE
jgi:TPR repeat protein